MLIQIKFTSNNTKSILISSWFGFNNSSAKREKLKRKMLEKQHSIIIKININSLNENEIPANSSQNFWHTKMHNLIYIYLIFYMRAKIKLNINWFFFLFLWIPNEIRFQFVYIRARGEKINVWFGSNERKNLFFVIYWMVYQRFWKINLGNFGNTLWIFRM